VKSLGNSILFIVLFLSHLVQASNTSSSFLSCLQFFLKGQPLQITPPFPKEKESLIEYIKKTASAPSLSGYVESAKVVFIGEHHPNESSRKYVISQLGDLKEKGFTVLALEMFNSKNQELLDRFSKNEASSKDLLMYLKAEWGWRPETYVALLEEAKKLGMKLVAIDDRTGGDTPARDQNMAQVLAKLVVEQPETKIVVFSGGIHASLESRERMHFLFKKKTGLPTFSIMIDWKNDFNRNVADGFPNESVYALVGDAFDSSGILTSTFVHFDRDRYFFDAYLFQP
jgi:uncharacterized iron-regulated protein